MERSALHEIFVTEGVRPHLRKLRRKSIRFLAALYKYMILEWESGLDNVWLGRNAEEWCLHIAFLIEKIRKRQFVRSRWYFFCYLGEKIEDYPWEVREIV